MTTGTVINALEEHSPARELGEYILSILLIRVIIVGGCVGCGFTIFFAIKKAAELQEMPTQEMSEEIAETIIVTGESGNNEIL